MKLKVVLTFVVVSVMVLFATILAVGSHGNPPLMIAVLFVSTTAGGIASGLILYLIWTWPLS